MTQTGVPNRPDWAHNQRAIGTADQGCERRSWSATVALASGVPLSKYAHKKLLDTLAALDAVPSDEAMFKVWLQAGAQLNLLQHNAGADEVIIYASGENTFVHSLVVPNARLRPPDQPDLLRWSTNPFTSVSSYVTGGGRQDVWIEREARRGSDTLDAGRDLLFGRTFEGWPEADRTYFELAQEYAHLAEIHWRPEHGAYCRYDDNGDLEQTVSITARAKLHPHLTLASFDWQPLEEYLAASDSSLVRLFDFTLLRRGSFDGWPDGPEEVVELSPDFFFRRKVTASAAYTRGVQIVRGRRPAEDVMRAMHDGWMGRGEREYADYLAHDLRHGEVTKISTAPGKTTNYFEAHENDLPFELSPAYFRAEVLSKYKTDREKYTVSDRRIGCRTAWSLRSYDVNDAGQIHAYICDLRALPYSEQLHWLAHNEAPKAGLSERAIENDFKGRWVSFQPPLQLVLTIAERWRQDGVLWWTLRDPELAENIAAPLTASVSEWADAFMDLSKLLAEGFEVKALRTRLDAAGMAYGPNDQSIALLEKWLGRNHGGGPLQLPGLRTVQRIRSKVKGHAGSSEAKEIERAAIAEHGSLPGHFNYVCEIVAAELESIERDL